MAMLTFLMAMIGVFFILDEIERVQDLVLKYLNWRLSVEEWEREKRRTITVSSPRARLSYRRKEHSK
jgi:hypothetical protein